MKKWTKRIAVLLAAILVVGTMTVYAGEGAEAEKQTIKIAVNTCFSGTAARGAELQFNGFQVGLNEINESGYSQYYDFEVIVNDDQNDPTAAASVANKSVNEQKVQVVYGHLNAVQTLAGLAVYDEAGIPCLTPTTSSSVTNFGSDYLLQMGIADDATCKIIVDYLAGTLGLTNLAVMYSNNEQGYAALDTLKASLSEYGLSFACEEEYAMSDVDFSGQLLRIKDKACEAVLIWGGDPASRANIIKQLHQTIDYDILIAGDTQFSTAGFLNSVESNEKDGILCVGAWTPTMTDERSLKFIEEFKAIDSQGANPSDVSARGYDSIYFLATALNELGPVDISADDFEEVLLEQLKKTTIEGLQGTIQYQEDGRCVSNAYICRISPEGKLDVVQ